MNYQERYNEIMGQVEIFERYIENKSHEDIADFYSYRFDSMQGIAEDLLKLLGEGRTP